MKTNKLVALAIADEKSSANFSIHGWRESPIHLQDQNYKSNSLRDTVEDLRSNPLFCSR